jgi:hypothetical protein
VLDTLARLFIGPAADLAADLTPQLAALERPGRAPAWIAATAEKARYFSTKGTFVQPFFNHVAGHTRRQDAA